MKKIYILTFVALLSACAALTDGSGSSSDTTSAKMKTCLMTEASSRYQAGTLFTNSIKTTASDLVKTCMQRLALQSAGISASSQSTAENIVSALRSMQGAN